jgi:nicotinate-nucleotide--dimethylbenzimidazole phosphoribosyltransferase
MDKKVLDDAMRAHLDNLTKPRGSLGKLEDYCVKMARIQQKVPPKIGKKGLYVFGGDHGISDEGVSLYPKEVSFQMAMNMLSGGAGVNVLADATGWEANVVDSGIDWDFPPESELNAKNRFIPAKIMRGSKNFLKESAMTEEETEAALSKGRELASDAEKQGYNMVAVGDLGIGNTSTAAAMLIAAGMEADAIIDRGTGIDDKQLAHKKRVIKEGVLNRRPVKNPYSIMRETGAPDLAMMTGFILGLEGRGIACVLDGFPVTSAAYMAYMINPAIVEYTFAGHLSKVAGHKVALSALGLDPIVSLDMHLGEGSGAVIGGFIVQLGVLCALNMASFDNTNVSGKDAEEQKY